MLLNYIIVCIINYSFQSDKFCCSLRTTNCSSDPNETFHCLKMLQQNLLDLLNAQQALQFI